MSEYERISSIAINGRILEYPDLADQLDALWHDIHNGTLDTTGVFYNLIKTVKDNHPKPDMEE
jgi:hypothetical protein